MVVVSLHPCRCLSIVQLMSATNDLLQFTAVEPPGFDASVVAEAVTQQFGLAGDYALLVSERDQNFCLTTVSSLSGEGHESR